jgi:hypothetical protein
LEEARSLTLGRLSGRIVNVSSEARSQVEALPLSQVEAL